MQFLHNISASKIKIIIIKAFWIVYCHVSCLWMKKNYHSLYVGMLYVIDTREPYLHLYCLRILFVFGICLWICGQKKVSSLLWLSGFLTMREMLHLLTILSLSVTQFSRSISLLCHLEPAKSTAEFYTDPDVFSFFCYSGAHSGVVYSVSVVLLLPSLGMMSCFCQSSWRSISLCVWERDNWRTFWVVL